MEINIDKAVIEQAVTDAVVKSAIGDKIRVAVAQTLSKGYNCPIDKAIEQVIAEIALKVVRDEYQEEIKVAVKEKMQDHVLADVVNAFFDRMIAAKDKRDW